MNNLGDLSEFPFLKKIRSQFSSKLPPEITGIGDDCAIIPLANGFSTLVTTDLFLEGCHFLKNKMSARDVGYKALAVNISDIAAMGGLTQYAFLALGLPADLELSWIEDFYMGFQELAESEKIYLLGGDTTKSLHEITINVTLIGSCETSKVKKRSAAVAADFVCVTDVLGDSSAGLKILLQNLRSDVGLVQKHCRPKAQSQEGIWLANFPEVHGMLDLSDGLDSDARHLMEESKCGLEIELESIPYSEALCRFCLRENLPLEQFTVFGGEDYSLLLTVDCAYYEELSTTFFRKFGRKLYKIGCVTNQKNELTYKKHGTKVMLEGKVYEHFTNK